MAQDPVKFPLPCRALLGKTQPPSYGAGAQVQHNDFKYIVDIIMTSLDLIREIYNL